MKTAVSIVEFNTKDLLRKCLISVLNQKMQSDNHIEIWVVDNNSKDKSVEMVRSEFPNVRLIENPQNVGFAKGHNTALKQIKADYVLILNSDAELQENSIGGMVEFMNQHPDCGVASCRIIDMMGNLQPNGGDLPLGLALFAWLFNLESFGNLPNFHRNEKNYYEKVHEVGWISGSFMMVRKEVFEKVGFLNEGYFMYFEDTEFCFKAHKQGFKVMINPGIVTKHVGGASSEDPKLRQWRGEMKGLIHFYNKQFGSFYGSLIKLLVYLSILFRIIGYTFLGKFNFAAIYGKIIFSI